MKVAELRTAAEVRQHFVEVQRRINEQRRAQPAPEPVVVAQEGAPLDRQQRIALATFAVTADHFRIPLDDILSAEKRGTKLQFARSAAFYVAQHFVHIVAPIAEVAHRKQHNVRSNIVAFRRRLAGDVAAVDAANAIGSRVAAELALRWAPARRRGDVKSSSAKEGDDT